eukprot:TRINITY_DN6438_c0_g1_i1.p1 TRINITY_DN6438_c0_g1~~TRINITY_DN6438_c0_g1_i1.p1  ORF type:complete len:164 (+),score=20.85 TRINITY_DN6438_c0_g1_i1:51-542(+)
MSSLLDYSSEIESSSVLSIKGKSPIYLLSDEYLEPINILNLYPNPEEGFKVVMTRPQSITLTCETEFYLITEYLHLGTEWIDYMKPDVYEIVSTGNEITFVVRTSEGHSFVENDIVELYTLYIGRIDGGDKRKLIFFISESDNIKIVGKYHRYITPEQMKNVW